MKHAPQIAFYARQLKNVCTILEDVASTGQLSMDTEEVDPVSADLILNGLEQAQTLILSLTEKITSAVSSEDPGQANADDSAFAPGELDAKKETTIENPVTEKED